jgi:hypothetical protein
MSEKSAILTSECRALCEGAITTYFKRLRFDAAGTSEARIHYLPDANASLTLLRKRYVRRVFYKISFYAANIIEKN